jgi:hypothetical protein
MNRPWKWREKYPTASLVVFCWPCGGRISTYTGPEPPIHPTIISCPKCKRLGEYHPERSEAEGFPVYWIDKEGGG